MYEVFGSVRGLLKFDAARMDDNVFRLHYRVTVVLLLSITAVLSARQYVGSSAIECLVDGVPRNVMETYCWIYSTYSVAGRTGGALLGVAADAPGHPVRYHRYYQWVCVVLFVQSLFFYAPRYLWKTWEGGRIRRLVAEQPPVIAGAAARTEYRGLLVAYLARELRGQRFYVARYALCELLNAANAAGQMLFLDWFLGGEFAAYGLHALRLVDRSPDGGATDPMARVFPMTAKCAFRKYGPSGAVQRFDGLCLLPLNAVNEKVFVFLWFWYAFVAAVSVAQLARRLLVLAVPPYRCWLLRDRARLAPANKVRLVCKRCNAGEWFLLHQLADNLDSVVLKEVLTDLARRLGDGGGGGDDDLESKMADGSVV